MFEEEQRILTTAIETWQPVAVVVGFSGGYDSMITAHVTHQLDTHGLPIEVWAIDTNLSADGWREYVTGVATRFGWNFNIYDNKRGFEKYKRMVSRVGQPLTPTGHSWAFRYLKERGFDAIHMMHKKHKNDKTLFLAGTRRAESLKRINTPEVDRVSSSNKILANPIVHWSNEQCDVYRIENSLPDNPFYDTVRGSGDCQCNWGKFISRRILDKYSPALSAGNVAEIDRLARQCNGIGWDGSNEAQAEMFENYDGDAELTMPFLCQNCSRTKTRVSRETLEQVYIQRGLI
jgi:3'-phosphoadenosine 5'-phosphosulfate sulfotransferase (PAPS reductase)/FAD synthetase